MCSYSRSVFSFFIVSPVERRLFRVAGSTIVWGRIVFMLTNTERPGESSKHFAALDIRLDGKRSTRSQMPFPLLFGKTTAFCYPAHCREEALSRHCVSSAQAAARPARITAFRRIVTRATSSRPLRSCFRVLLNASCVNKTASRGSSVSREAKV